MKRAHAAVLALVLAAGHAFAAEPTVEQPRSFGHVLGDVLTQRVLLADARQSLTLPPAARVDLWLERRAPRIETDGQGRRWLAVDYQVINAPRALTAIALPALTVASDAGPALTLPAWPVSIGPLTPEQPFGQGDLQALRPDRPVAALPVATLERQLKQALAALVAVLLGWLGWWAWRNWREAQQLPFAHAWRALQGMNDPASPEAWRVLHRALNQSAGRVVHGASLPQLLAAAPWLRPLQPRLEDFFRESTQRFFAEGAAPQTAYPLKPLSRALRNAEKAQKS